MPLSEAEERLPEEVLAQEIPRLGGWSRSGEELTRTYDFKGFKSAMSFANRVADAATAADHHPDIHVEGYRHVRIVLTTHASGGISRADLDLARAIDAIAVAPGR